MGGQEQKKALLAGSVFLVCGALVLGMLQDEELAPAVSASSSSSEKRSSVSAPNQVLTQVRVMAKADAAIANAERILATAEEPDPVDKPDLPTVEYYNNDNPWLVAVEGDPSVPKIPLHSSVSDFSVVKLNHRPTGFPAPGETMRLPMFDGRSITANVKTVKTMSNGDRIWTGHLDGFGNDFSVVMTYGENLTFATINTPDGNYSLEAKDGVGWLYKNPSVLDLAGPDSRDFLVPDIH
jgi:hypothetical protein